MLPCTDKIIRTHTMFVSLLLVAIATFGATRASTIPPHRIITSGDCEELGEGWSTITDKATCDLVGLPYVGETWIGPKLPAQPTGAVASTDITEPTGCIWIRTSGNRRLMGSFNMGGRRHSQEQTGCSKETPTCLSQQISESPHG